MKFTTTKEQEEFRMKVRHFAEEEVKPIAFLLDKENQFPQEAVKKMGELGFMGIPYPKEYGGAGMDVISYAIAVEELSRVDGGTGVILSACIFGKLAYFCVWYRRTETKISHTSCERGKNRCVWINRAKCRK